MSDDNTLRTALYIQQPSSITIRAKDPTDATAQLYRYKEGLIGPAIGTHLLPRGIYLVLSKAPIEVTNSAVVTAVVPRDKDIWPDLSAGVVAIEAEAGATAESIQTFFLVAKGIGD